MPRKASAGAGAALLVADVCKALEAIAPLELAAEWDNVGLLIGDRRQQVRKLALTIDLTSPVLAEVLAARVQMVMAYHPIIFKTLRQLTAQAAPIAFAAARAGLSVYSMHTALDCATSGANDVLAGLLGLTQAVPLSPSPLNGSVKVVVFVPPGGLAKVSGAAFGAGAGRIENYTECSFHSRGEGTFRGQDGSRPAIGRAGLLEHVEELRLELVAPRAKLREVLSAIREAHSYETPAIDVYPMEQLSVGTGLGRLGRLDSPLSLAALVRRVKERLHVRRVQVAGKPAGPIRNVACCAGSCGELVQSAIAAGVQAMVTGEVRHHDALAAAEAGMAVICVGHSNSERPALPVLARRLRQLLPELEVSLALADRDPLEIG